MESTDSSAFEFDISQFKTVMQEASSLENGWTFEYEGIIDKNFPDSKMRVYNKIENSSKCGFTTRIDAIFRGVKAKNLVLMTRDIAYRKKVDHPPKKIRVIEKRKDTDVLYIELNLPYPLINRDLVQKRLFVGNKENPELAKKLDLFNCDHEYYAMLVESAVRPECPETSQPIRGETGMHYMFLEEDPKDKNVLKMRMVMNMDLAGDIPEAFMNAIRQNAPYRMMSSILTSYHKFFGGGKCKK